MASTVMFRTAQLPRNPGTPPLEPGDRLTRAEFERRYSGMPNVKKAELIEGVVYMPSPVRITRHARPHARLSGWLHDYVVANPGVDFADNATVRLDADNEPQPDLLLQILPEVGGQSRVSEDDYLEGAPELVAEVVSSSASYDLHEKKRAYRRNGVREYLAWLVDEERIEWWELKEGKYVSLPIEDGVIRSQTFPGLWLKVSALLDGNTADVRSALHQGLATESHEQFVKTLKTRMRG